MTVLMHLSDLHFGAHDPQVCAAALRLAQRLDVSMAVVSGDLTQRATAAQFAQAARFVQGLHARNTLVLAGNHDVPLFAWWMRWGRAYQRYAHQFGWEQEPVRQAGVFYVVGVNTTRPWRHERGSLSSAQVEQVARLLARAPPGAWPIVASHHPLVGRDAQDRAHRPSRADEAVQRWQAAGAQMLLSGHVHEPAVLQPRPGLWVSRAGTAVSHRLRHGSPNSLVVLSVELSGNAAGMQARYAARWDYDSTAGEFCCVQRQRVETDNASQTLGMD
ncbi:metallophosphoesterase [Acidovorax sp. JG5]|uniref:metallophosphoesterase family protein n=1 Tax=Acidovorax sp. JG5 TaxID=2822718 RepID=UPI001B319F1A|nr:metallophosphoesterase [Acidovorax sp. JG5]MBP3980026.1 metallophosphoesterase [Acidovorax sp. JG5]